MWEPEDRWEPYEQDVSHASGVSSIFVDDPPEDMPESRPLLGFKIRNREDN